MRKYGMDYCFCDTVILKVVFWHSQSCAIICRLFFNDDVILYLATKLYFLMKTSSCFNDVIIDDVNLYLAITLYLDCMVCNFNLGGVFIRSNSPVSNTRDRSNSFVGPENFHIHLMCKYTPGTNSVGSNSRTQSIVRRAIFHVKTL